jgi:hypothetical protein
MFKIKQNKEKNRLYITLSGIVSITEAKKARDQLIKEASELQPNFDLINDISGLIRAQEEAGKILQEIMLLLIEKKVNRVVRVVGESKEGLIQFANYSLPIASYKLKYIPTLEEAEVYLNKEEENK